MVYNYGIHFTKELWVNIKKQKVILGLCSFTAVCVFVVYLCSSEDSKIPQIADWMKRTKVSSDVSQVSKPRENSKSVASGQTDISNRSVKFSSSKVAKALIQKKTNKSMATVQAERVMSRKSMTARELISNHHIIHNQLNEVISEEEALKYQPCQDTRIAASPLFSKLRMLDSPGKVYNIGDRIYVLATLFDSNGGRKSTGGDHLRARIWNRNFSAPGAVYDYNNGSYSLIFEALWSGSSHISASIAYTREAITAFYRMPYKVVSLRTIMANYTNQKYTEAAACHPDKDHLLAHSEYKDVCNFTSLNSGMPWYCGKPRNPKLKCSDWKFVRSLPLQKVPSALSECEKELVRFRSHKEFIQNVTVTVKDRSEKDGMKEKLYYKAPIPCSEYNTTKLWYRKYTTGFFFNRQWKTTHCRGFKRTNFQECLRNKRLYLLGDSTTRQWYEHILERYNCTQFTEIWTDKKWKKPSECKFKGNNFSLTTAFHCQPIYLSKTWVDPSHSLTSISKRLEAITSDEDAIVLIHIFAHIRTIHYKYFAYKMQAIRASAERLLKRNNKVKIFIKMPHTFTQTCCNDFFGYVFSRIIFETFDGLYDTVTVLDQKDATISDASVNMHPNSYIVSSMVYQMFSYICE